jgi:hypothetical protein
LVDARSATHFIGFAGSPGHDRIVAWAAVDPVGAAEGLYPVVSFPAVLDVVTFSAG